MRHTSRVLLCLLLLGIAPARADDEPLLTPGQAADRVLAALEKNDEAALRAFSKTGRPDPWKTADELCYRGKHDAAAAFAAVLPENKSWERLPDYIESRRGKPPDEATRKAIDEANATFARYDFEAALRATQRGIEEGQEKTFSGARIRYGKGNALQRLKRFPESHEAFLEAAEASEAIGWMAGVGVSLEQAGLSAWYHADWPNALAALTRQRAVERARGNRNGEATALGNIGVMRFARSEYDEAIEALNEALAIWTEIGEELATSSALVNLANVYSAGGQFEQALENLEQALEIAEAAKGKDPRAPLVVLDALGNIGGMCVRFGDYDRALACYERALHEARELIKARRLPNRVREGMAYSGIGTVYSERGDYARALEYLEKALTTLRQENDRWIVAHTLGQIGHVHNMCGDHESALKYHTQSLELVTLLDDRSGVSSAHGSIGGTYYLLARFEDALRHQKLSLKMARDLGAKAEEAATLGNIGIIHHGLGQYDEAIEYHTEALETATKQNVRGSIASSHLNLGFAYRDRGDPEQALASFQRGRDEAQAIGHGSWTAMALMNLAATNLELGHVETAKKNARDAVAMLPLLVGRLADEQGATARDDYALLMETGVRIGVALDDPGEVWFFLETGRAGALLESLGGRKALGNADIPEDLVQAERMTRDAVAEAQTALATAKAEGKRKVIRKARKALDRKKDELLKTVDRIQRVAKAAADVQYPTAAPLDAVRQRLRTDDALVSYALLEGETVALVVTKATEPRIVPLGETKAIEAAIAALQLDDPKHDPEAALAALRTLVLDPLKLSSSTTRLIVSPAGALSYVSFAALTKKHEIAYVPSGTTYDVLRDEGASRGDKTLALGDPLYGPRVNATSLAVHWGDRSLVSLPATREEVENIGDVRVLGEDATEANLRTQLADQERWRAVHFACHGRVEPDRPMLSSLALTPDAKNDGFLTAVEIFRMRIPADLAVLSACETAKGKVYRTEGIVGLTRAFMFAGAPRVICSLWKVDDKATQALMIKFYELWNPKDGGQGLDAAEALTEAQAYIRDHPDHDWEHPYYWAAWVLWGLPD